MRPTGWHRSGPFFSPGDGLVDHAIFIVRVLRHGFKDELTNIALAPARMAQIHDAKVAEARR